MKRDCLLFYCQHSVGMGHLMRAFALARALTTRFDVVLLNGGPLPPGIPVPAGVEVIDLPPLGTDDGHVMVGRAGVMDVAAAKEQRRALLLEVLARYRPRVLLVELFPFGRKKFAYELLPLLKAARRLGAERPLVVSSVRDLLVAARPDQQQHDDRAAWLCNRYFDGVLVHADERLARLDETFRPRRALRIPVVHTGLVAPPQVVSHTPRGRHWVVSAGGGMVGAPLFNAIIAAHARWPVATRPPLRVITGPFLPEADWHALEDEVADRTDVELVRSVPDLAAEMRAAAVSLSQCGYNTAMDLLVSGVPAGVVPYAVGREDEQQNRAQRLEQMGLVRALSPALLAPERTAELLAALQALASFQPAPGGLKLDGAATSVAWLDAALAQAADATVAERKVCAA